MIDPTRTADPHAVAGVTASAADPATTTAPPPGSSTASTFTATSERYVLGEEIARGGMGEVYRATDMVLNREVAVKVLQPKYGPTSAAARRFHDEARITGQLQHPAVPPVHDLGTLPDGRPFLAMKLIKGRTLDDELKARPSPSADQGRFVAVFEQIAHAVAYAHAHGVIHRDLKPANVMVGNYGEVQVMDWGLAKVLTDRGREGADSDPEATAAETGIKSLRDSDDQFTQAGSVLGTPAFMPPEQAIGAVDQIDRRSDVFGLGGILAVVLTGKPPFESETAESTRQMSAKGKVGDCFTRLDGCSADPELVALCKRCLSAEMDDRPADAGGVAKAVAEFRAAADERARRAELDRVRAEGEKAAAELKTAEQRRRSRLRLMLAAAIGLLLLGGGASAWWQDREAAARRTEAETHARDERDRLDRNADAVAGLLGQCDDALRAGDAARAEVSLAAAEKRSAEGGADAHAPRLARCTADLAVLRELDAIRRYEWTQVDNKFPTWQQLAGRYRATFARFGVGPGAVAADVARWVAASAVRDRLVAALDSWLHGADWDKSVWRLELPDAAQKSESHWVLAVLRAADPDDFRDRVRDAIHEGEATVAAALATEPEAATQPPWFLAVFAQKKPLFSPVRQRQMLAAAAARRPDDLTLLMVLGRIATDESDAKDALRWYQAAAAVAPANPTPHLRLGNTHQKLQDFPAAEWCYREALRLAPTDPEVRFALGSVLLVRPDALAEGIGHLREAVRANPQEPRYHCNLGHLLRENGDYAEALAAMRTGHDLGRRDRGWEYPSAQWVTECERLAALDEKRAAVVAGKAKPKDATEMFEFARISRVRKRYAEAVRLYRNGFDAEFLRLDGASLMRDKIAAAGAAVLSCGTGVDPLPPANHPAARAQAREWLDEIVGPLRFMVGVPSARANVHAQMVGLLENPDFASLRDPAARAALPKAEADQWANFWNDIRQIHTRTIPLELAPPPRLAK